MICVVAVLSCWLGFGIRLPSARSSRTTRMRYATLSCPNNCGDPSTMQKLLSAYHICYVTQPTAAVTPALPTCLDLWEFKQEASIVIAVLHWCILPLSALLPGALVKQLTAELAKCRGHLASSAVSIHSHCHVWRTGVFQTCQMAYLTLQPCHVFMMLLRNIILTIYLCRPLQSCCFDQLIC